jgi:K+-transporting ATPase ATPase A chain
MILSRFLIIVPILALAGSLSLKKVSPVSAGTLPTHNLFFSILLLSIIIIVGALTFIPALVLGPIIEHII